jgi:hypothetical protein
MQAALGQLSSQYTASMLASIGVWSDQLGCPGAVGLSHDDIESYWPTQPTGQKYPGAPGSSSGRRSPPRSNHRRPSDRPDPSRSDARPARAPEGRGSERPDDRRNTKHSPHDTRGNVRRSRSRERERPAYRYPSPYPQDAANRKQPPARSSRDGEPMGGPRERDSDPRSGRLQRPQPNDTAAGAGAGGVRREGSRNGDDGQPIRDRRDHGDQPTLRKESRSSASGEQLRHVASSDQSTRTDRNSDKGRPGDDRGRPGDDKGRPGDEMARRDSGQQREVDDDNNGSPRCRPAGITPRKELRGSPYPVQHTDHSRSISANEGRDRRTARDGDDLRATLRSAAPGARDIDRAAYHRHDESWDTRDRDGDDLRATLRHEPRGPIYPERTRDARAKDEPRVVKARDWGGDDLRATLRHEPGDADRWQPMRGDDAGYGRAVPRGWGM